MPMVAEVVDAVVGIDTHRDSHQVEIAAANAVVIATTTLRNDDAGYARLVEWIHTQAPGPELVVSVEGTRSYGIGVTRALLAAGLVVIECEQPRRRQRRGKGKSDPIDAHLAVLFALGCDIDKLPTPRADGDREALRILMSARGELTTSRTAQINRLKALLRDVDDHDRDVARATLTQRRLGELIRRRPPTRGDRQQRVRHAEIHRLALAVRHAGQALRANETQLREIVNDLVPGLTSQPGIGPMCAAQAIVSFSHVGRCRHEAAYARLGGSSPIEASSGRTIRHRLNRGGDRALNRALHIIATTRMRSDPTTRDYLTRRRTENKTDREIRRCLKRYIARQLYRTLTTAMATPIPPAPAALAP